MASIDNIQGSRRQEAYEADEQAPQGLRDGTPQKAQLYGSWPSDADMQNHYAQLKDWEPVPLAPSSDNACDIPGDRPGDKLREWMKEGDAFRANNANSSKAGANIVPTEDRHVNANPQTANHKTDPNPDWAERLCGEKLAPGKNYYCKNAQGESILIVRFPEKKQVEPQLARLATGQLRNVLAGASLVPSKVNSPPSPQPTEKAAPPAVVKATPKKKTSSTTTAKEKKPSAVAVNSTPSTQANEKAPAMAEAKTDPSAPVVTWGTGRAATATVVQPGPPIETREPKPVVTWGGTESPIPPAVSDKIADAIATAQVNDLRDPMYTKR